VDVDAIPIRGEWIRHAPHRSALPGRSPEPSDGRWQRGDTVRALYLADEPDTAVAEWYRFLAERGVPPSRAIPHDHPLWKLDIKLADLSTNERLERVGLGPPRPGRRTWPPFQAVGEGLWRKGWAGLVAPSAAKPAAQIACVFDRGIWPPEGCKPLRAIEITDVPVPPTGMTT
jgi:RES domain-containing protein